MKSWERRWLATLRKPLNCSTVLYFYNTERPHMSCGMLTPCEAGQSSGTLEKSGVAIEKNF
jgi:ISPsy11, transposase orfB